MSSKQQLWMAAGVIAAAGAAASSQVIDGGEINRTYSNLYAYFDAGEGVDKDSGDFVLSWNNLAESRADPWLQDLYNIVGFPWWIDGAVNGQPAVDFDEASGVWSPRDEFGEVHQPNTYFAVARVDNTCAEFSGYIFDSSTSGSRIALLYSQNANPCNWTMYAGSVIDSAVPVAAEEFQIHTVVVDGTSSSHYINGELAYSGDAGDGYQWGLILGMRYSASSGLLGQIAEFILYDELLGDSDRTAVEEYLSAKYAIELGGGGCYADYDGNGTVNTQDFLAYLNAWASGDPGADCNGDATVNTQDFLCFLNLWAQGC